MTTPGGLRFRAGGTVNVDEFYITRPADAELFAALRAREFCRVLAPRQIGKTSLCERVRRQLGAEGTKCVVIDMSSQQTVDVTPDTWYRTIAFEIALKLGIVNSEFWSKEEVTPLDRWLRFLRDFLLARVEAPVVLFIDELDSLPRVKSFNTDDFLASIRSLYNARPNEPQLKRLTFCLLGVVAPSDLISDTARTSFNVGVDIHLEDFSRADIEPLAAGLAGSPWPAGKLLDGVFDWTSGHPYMTQRLCERLASMRQASGEDASAVVKRLVHEIFLEGGAASDMNLAEAVRRFDDAAAAAEMLGLYKRLRRGEAIRTTRGDRVQEDLRLTGIARVARGNGPPHLEIRNHVFATVFDDSWVAAREARRKLTIPMQAWRENKTLPSGEALAEIQQYARGRTDLTPDEHEFIREAMDAEVSRKQQELDHERRETKLREEEARLRQQKLDQEVTLKQQKLEQEVALRERERAQFEEETRLQEQRTALLEEERAVGLRIERRRRVYLWTLSTICLALVSIGSLTVWRSLKERAKLNQENISEQEKLNSVQAKANATLAKAEKTQKELDAEQEQLADTEARLAEMQALLVQLTPQQVELENTKKRIAQLQSQVHEYEGLDDVMKECRGAKDQADDLKNKLFQEEQHSAILQSQLESLKATQGKPCAFQGGSGSATNAPQSGQTQ